MKRNEEDIQIGNLLKEQGYQPNENKWFTPRVLHRLPEPQRSLRWVWWGVCAVAAIICALCWWWTIEQQDQNVLTVRDIVHYAIMGIISLVLLCQSIAVTLQRE
ncbi:MAG: hypothetical protein J5565_04895 [Muribaculaceae bacterium]|nr:hypothetical protein [Muribaculaceae bacterium]